jgi:hypothetical protein
MVSMYDVPLIHAKNSARLIIAAHWVTGDVATSRRSIPPCPVQELSLRTSSPAIHEAEELTSPS